MVVAPGPVQLPHITSLRPLTFVPARHLFQADFAFALKALELYVDRDIEMVPLKAVVITQDANSGRKIRDELSQFPYLVVNRVVDGFPNADDLHRIVQLHVPEVILIDCRAIVRAIECAGLIESLAVGLPVIALDPPDRADALIQLMRTGVREILSTPLESTAFEQVLNRVARLVQRQPPTYAKGGRVHCFIPAKPGVGASVLAANTALSLARASDKPVLLCDLDTTLGMASFYVNASPTQSVHEAVQYAHRLDEDLWGQLVWSDGNLDLLGPGNLAAGPLDAEAIIGILDFAGRLYHSIVIDFSGHLEPFCTQILQHATNTFLVCTQEVPALHVGRLKASVLQSLSLNDRLSILLNRIDNRQALSIAEIEKLLSSRVRCTFANDYKRLNAAMVQRQGVDMATELGKQIHAFACSLLGSEHVSLAPRKRRFLEFFSPIPVSYSLEKGHR